MKDQFVPYELAVKLKELGFDEECLAGYYNDGKSLWFFRFHKNSEREPTVAERFATAPLWQQAFDWFWDKYEMWGEYFPWNPQINNWKIAIFYKVNGEYNDSEYFINGNLNEARQACLEKLLEFK